MNEQNTITRCLIFKPIYAHAVFYFACMHVIQADPLDLPYNYINDRDCG